MRGTLSSDAAFRAKSPTTTHLVVGPWSHMPWNRAAGAADMGIDAEFSVDRAQIEFFDFYLKGEGERPVAQQLFDMGTRRWGQSPLEPTAQQYFIASSGLASTLLSDGRLEPAPGPAYEDRVVHDPTNPAPLIGGHLDSPLGFADRSGADNRADVAVYTTAPLATILPLAGLVNADLWIETSADFDLCAALTLVDPSGAARVLCTGFLRSTQQGQVMVQIDLGAVCVTVLPGNRLRLSVQGAGANAFENYPDTPADIRQPLPNQTPITLCIRHGDATPSRLILPIRAKDAHDVD